LLEKLPKLWGRHEHTADCRNFTNLRPASVCTGSTARRGKIEGGCTKSGHIIKGDKAKTQVYCKINDLSEQIGEADQKTDNKKAEALSQQVIEMEKKLGPEYFALVNDLNNVDPNSPEGQEIDSILAPLDESCDD
jgi:hypothetical protein